MPNESLKKKQVIPVKSMITSVGTWTAYTNTGIPYILLATTASARTPTVSIPIEIDSTDGQHGVKLTSIEIPVRFGIANLATAPTLTLYRRNMLAVAGAGTNLSASSITGTKTGLTATKATTDRLLTFTVTTPALDYTTEDKASYALQLWFSTGASTTVRIYDAIAYYDIPV